MAYFETAHLGGTVRHGRPGVFSNLVAALRRFNQQRRARVALLSLSDHHLADIGLTRGQIERAEF